MPLTSTGKADRTALAASLPAAGESAERPAEQEHWTGPQRIVWDIWVEVLGHRDVGLEDSFFGLGGSSLKILDLYSRLDARWPGAIRAGELFDLVTVEAQAGVIDDRVGTGVGERNRPGAGRPAPVSYEL
nr:phosphopantetheine-binding protein [Streptomyces taklimakanensis]